MGVQVIFNRKDLEKINAISTVETVTVLDEVLTAWDADTYCREFYMDVEVENIMLPGGHARQNYARGHQQKTIVVDDKAGIFQSALKEAGCKFAVV